MKVYDVSITHKQHSEIIEELRLKLSVEVKHLRR